jgi:hypothetical protein
MLILHAKNSRIGPYRTVLVWDVIPIQLETFESVNNVLDYGKMKGIHYLYKI